MKNLKKIITIVLTVVMLCSLSTVAFARSLNSINIRDYSVYITPATITQGTTEATFRIGIKDTSDTVMDIPVAADSSLSNFSITFTDSALGVVEVTEVTSSLGTPVDVRTNVDDGETSMVYVYGNITLDKSAVSATDVAFIDVKCKVSATAQVGTYSLAAADGEIDKLAITVSAGETTGALLWDESPAIIVEEAAQKTPYSIAKNINTNATIKGAEKTYTGVWVGTYTVTPNDDVVTGITINGETINKTLAEGEGQVIFKIAAIPAPATEPVVNVNVQ